MREPAFWWQAASWKSRLLGLLGVIYGMISARRMKRAGTQAKIPVVCVGNYHVGGAGKTPTVIALIGLLRQMGETPVVLSRGYGGSLRGPVLVDQKIHTSIDVGDEPLLIASHVPVVVSRDRVAGTETACGAGATVLVMDDGFQNPSLQKDLSIVVIDANRGTGNGSVFPAGPLRVPLSVQVPRTDLLLIIGNDNAADAVASDIRARGKNVLRARIAPQPEAIAGLAGKRALAFAGIGDPERFFNTLRHANIDVAITQAFSDHHPYTRAEIDALKAEAQASGLTLVTTEKDMIRLRDFADGIDAPIAALPITLEIDDQVLLRDVLQHCLAARRAG